MRYAVAAVLIVFAVGSAAALELSPKDRAKRVLARRSYQLELPKERAVAPLFKFGSLGPGFTRLIGGLGYAALLVAAGALIFALVKRRDGRDGGGKSLSSRPSVAPAARADPPVTTRGPTLDDADLLAASGDYRAAIHALLLVAIDVGARLTLSSFPPSATARELTHLLPLDGATHEGFRALVRAVERSLFAGRDVGADDYTVCRAHCVAVARWRAA